jgi:hypothetical protein
MVSILLGILEYVEIDLVHVRYYDRQRQLITTLLRKLMLAGQDVGLIKNDEEEEEELFDFARLLQWLPLRLKSRTHFLHKLPIFAVRSAVSSLGVRLQSYQDVSRRDVTALTAKRARVLVRIVRWLAYRVVAP